METYIEQILEILIEQEGLTAKQIYNQLKKNQFKKTYQHLCNILKELHEEEVLEKKKLKYYIVSAWFDKKIDFYKELKQKYHLRGSKIIFSDNKLQVLSFKSLKSLNDYWIHLIEKEIQTKNISSVYWEGPNCWWLFTNMADEIKYIDFLKNKNIEAYFLIKINNKLNKDSCEFYSKNKCQAKIISSFEGDTYIHRGIVGNTIIEVSYPQTINKFFDEIYKQNKQSIFLDNIKQIDSFEEEITLKVYKDTEYSDKLITERLKHFN